MVARKSKERLATAAVELKRCSGCLMPPKRKQQPMTRRRLESTEPRREDCTMRISLWTRAWGRRGLLELGLGLGWMIRACIIHSFKA